MTLYNKLRVSLSTVLLVPCVVFSQKPEHPLDIKDTITFNSHARKATLPNGFTYYISRNATRPGKMFVEFVVKAGTLQVDKDQTTEMPHLIEHIMFRAEMKFKGDGQISLKSYLKDIGAEYNGGTGLSYTNFTFSTPSDTSVLKNLLPIFNSWISGKRLLNHEEISAEKNVVIAEHIARCCLAPGERKIDEKILYPSRFSEVGQWTYITPRKIADLHANTFRKFYEDWYRPNLSAVIVTGDIDIDVTERLLRSVFIEVENPASQRKHEEYPVKLIGANKYITETRNDEIVKVRLLFLKEHLRLTTRENLKESLLTELFNTAVANRSNNPIATPKNTVSVSMGQSLYHDLTRHFAFSMKITRGKFIENGLKLLFTEAERITRFGFNENELNKARSQLLLNAVNDSESLPAEAARYLENFINREAVPSKKALDSLRVQFLQKISLPEFNRFVRSWNENKNRIIVVESPFSEKRFVPTEAIAIQWLKEIQTSEILSTYALTDKPEEVVIRKSGARVNFDSCYRISASSVYTSEKFSEKGITELRLDNGVRVILKQKSIGSTDRIYLRAIKSISSFNPMHKFFFAHFAPLLVSGNGELDENAFNLYKEQYNINAGFGVRDGELNISGSSSQREVELLLQIVYRYFQTPHVDSVSAASKIFEWNQHARINPQTSVLRELPMLINDNEFLEPTEINFHEVVDSYKELFSSASGFTFVIAGVNNDDAILSLVLKYLGSLPGSKGSSVTNLYPKSLNVNKTRVNKRIRTERGGEVLVMYAGHDTISIRDEIHLQILSKILERICFERLRERENGTYQMTSRFDIHRASIEYMNYEIGVVFKCMPSIRHRLIKAVQDEVKMLAANGPKAQDFRQVIEAYKSPRNLTEWDDQQWASAIADQYERGRDFYDLFKIAAIIDSTTPKDIQKAAQRYLRKKNFISYSEIPEE